MFQSLLVNFKSTQNKKKIKKRLYTIIQQITHKIFNKINQQIQTNFLN